MPNTNCLEGMACPKCGSEEPFRIDMMGTVQVYDDGTKHPAEDTNWNQDSDCMCCKCNHSRTVVEFRLDYQKLIARTEKLRDKAAELYAGAFQNSADFAVNVRDDAPIEEGEDTEWVQVWVRIPPEEMEHTQ